MAQYIPTARSYVAGLRTGVMSCPQCGCVTGVLFCERVCDYDD